MAESLQLGDHDRLRYNLQLATRWVVTVAALLAGAVVALRRELLGGLYGPAYVAGGAAVVVLAGTHFVSASCGLVGWVLVAGGRSRLILLNNFLGASFNVGASLLLIPRYGLLGGALASLGTMMIVLGSALIEVLAVEKVSPFSFGLWKPHRRCAGRFRRRVGCARARLGRRPFGSSPCSSRGWPSSVGVLFAAGLPVEERRWIDHLRAKMFRAR